jgi:hypothetical protein
VNCSGGRGGGDDAVSMVACLARTTPGAVGITISRMFSSCLSIDPVLERLVEMNAVDPVQFI